MITAMDDHYIKEKNITPEMYKKITELRNAIKTDIAGFPQYNTEFCMLRWLMGWNYNIGMFFCTI